jgi:hypothetical protein
MASQNWDDHDRSNRFTALSMAKKYLDSVDENGILFTIGDNDTFALWYAQEIEGYRTDVRTINTSLFATDWYIDQMRRKSYESEAIKTVLEHDDYLYGTNDAILYNEDERLPDTLDIMQFMKYIKSDNKTTRAELQNGEVINTYPTKNIRIPVNKENVLKNGIVKAEDADLIEENLYLTLTTNQISKHRLLMLDLLASNNWERPIAFTGGSFGDDDYLWLKDYLQMDGVIYQLVPIKTPINPRIPFDMGRVDVDKNFEIMTNWYWGNSGSDDMYHDPETRKNSISYRSNMARVVEKLLQQKDHERAKVIMDLAMEKMPVDKFGFYTLTEPFISGYYEIDEDEKARTYWNQVVKKYQEQLTYFSSLDLERQYYYIEDIITDIERYRTFVDIIIRYEEKEVSEEKALEFNEYIQLFSHFYEAEEEDLNQELLNEIEADELDEAEVDTIETDVDLEELMEP